MSEFDPNNIGVPNGRYFALPFEVQESTLVLVSVPWDVTTSYRPGTANGPEAIIDASTQVDLYDFDNKEFWKKGIGTLDINAQVLEHSKESRKIAEHIIDLLEQGYAEDSAEVKPYLDKVNNASEKLNAYVYNTTKDIIESGKLVGLVGGDHSVPFGYIKALSEKHEEFGVLHIDAHADLREAYEGFEFSHASIMYNTIHHIPQVKSLVQVGIRDIGKNEFDLIERESRIHTFNDYLLAEEQFNGKSWAQLCKEMLSKLPDKVYISFDIDGLSPDNCPNTGTPVPGGLSFHQANYLIKQLGLLGKRIIGFDLCETSPSDNGEWDAVVGARVLYKLCGYCINSN